MRFVAVITGPFAARFATQVLSSFAAMALLLASIGIYGVLSLAVAQRRRELGIRMALGAERGRVVRLVLREMLPVILIGIVAGAVTGLICGRYVETQLFGLKAADPAVFLTSVGALLIVSMSAAFVPAWRASRIDPIRALRCE